MSTTRNALVLVNLGTPANTEVASVRAYLQEFLMDPYVIDIPWPLRFALVHGIILRKRPAKSAEAYKKVWTNEGSPLAVFSERFLKKFKTYAREQRDTSTPLEVFFAMRYGEPSISRALSKIKAENFDKILVFPLYPQYSLAATETVVQKVRQVAKEIGLTSNLKFVPAFYNHPLFIKAFGDIYSQHTVTKKFDHVLFSFHGVPERHIKKTDKFASHCLQSAGCCDNITDANAHCYRAQSFATAKLIANEVKLSRDAWSVSFQSRLGVTPWIQPYTDKVLPELAAKGVKKLAVMCPAFVADCLETLEEIKMRANDSFRAAGGESLELIPSLNDHESWIEASYKISQTYL